jgi:O-methyltransferase
VAANRSGFQGKEQSMKSSTMIRAFVKKLLGSGSGVPTETSVQSLLRSIDAEQSRSAALEARVAALEERLFGYYRNRWDVIDKLADYLVGTQIPGDYIEFGVFEGRTFAYAARVMARLFPKMRFVALDSFAGLPEPQGVDAFQAYTSGFFKGQFACSEEAFRANVLAAGLDPSRLRIVAGWFDQSLQPGNPKLDGIDAVAAAWIDCDLYESTVPVLEFLSGKLAVGTVLLFDDWRCFRNLADFGQQRAWREWLARHPQIKLNSFVDFGFHGQSFTVAAC